MGKKRTKYATIVNLLDVRLEHCTLLPFELRSALQLWQRHNHRQSKSKAQPHLHARSQIMQQQKLKRCWKDWRTICSYYSFLFFFSFFISSVVFCVVFFLFTFAFVIWTVELARFYLILKLNFSFSDRCLCLCVCEFVCVECVPFCCCRSLSTFSTT